MKKLTIFVVSMIFLSFSLMVFAQESNEAELVEKPSEIQIL